MKRMFGQSSPSWLLLTAAAIGATWQCNVPSARGELGLSLAAHRITESKSDFLLAYFGELEDDGQPPAPSPTIPFNLSFDWRARSTPADPDPVISSLDRTTLEGLPAAQRFWTFDFGLSTGFQTDANGNYDGVLNLEMFLRGEHLDGPSADDVDPNPLRLIRSDPVSVLLGDLIRAKGARNQVSHPNSSGPDGIDRYGFRTSFVVGSLVANGLPLQQVPTSPNPTRNVLIAARHFRPRPPSRPGEPPKRTGMTLGAGESFAFYDSSTDSLVLSGGPISDLQLQPEPSGNGGAQQELVLADAERLTDPEFAGDPLLDFSLFRIESAGGFDTLGYVGFDSNRSLHVFSGGSLAIEHLFGTGDFTFNSSFEEMLYDPVSGDFFAVLTAARYSDFPNAPGYSPFLDRFTDAHLFSDDPRSRGIMFSFNMPGLAEATNGFTETFFPNDPAAFLLTGVFVVPEPASSSLWLAAAAMALLAVVPYERGHAQ